MTVNTKTLHYIYVAAVALIVGLFFSYRPTFSFGTVSGTNLEISATQFAIGAFILACAPLLWRARAQLYHTLSLRILSGLALLSTISLLYTPNLTRGVLFTTLLWVITVAWAAIIVSVPILKRYFAPLRLVGFWVVTITAVFAWFQVYAEAMGASTTFTLLPEAYLSGVFGFARPTAFALEPQFLGSLLVAPLLYTAYLEMTRQQTRFSRIVLLLSASALLATISRGAYLATAIGFLLLFAFYAKANIAASFKLISILSATALVTIGLLGFAAHLNQRDSISGEQAILKSVSQLSLGTISIDSAPVLQQPSVAQPALPTSGYVASSTDSRLSMAETALKLWSSTPGTVLFGVGSGGFGTSLHQADSTYPKNSVVNNHYLETLVELGLVGLAVFIGVIGSVLLLLIRDRAWLAVAIITAVTLQWLFFSGSINVLHIWVLLAASVAFIADRKNTVRLKQA